MENDSIKVHPLSDNPTAAWKEISKNQKLMLLKFKIPKEPVGPNKVRFVCMSDTHSLEHDIPFNIPDGDVFIHAGDFTRWGEENEVIRFNTWLTNLPHKYKIVIGGNHEIGFNDKFSKKNVSGYGQPNGYNYTNGVEYFESRYGPGYPSAPYTPIYNNYGYADSHHYATETDMRQYLTNCIYLEDSSFEVYGIKLYGTPWQPEYRGFWAFHLKRGQECLSKWNLIPNDTDILITHTPPLGYGDLTSSGLRAGCVELLSTVQHRVDPKYHVFGHIHEGYGVFSDGRIIYLNASTCDTNYVPKNLPLVFDVPLPEGQKKI